MYMIAEGEEERGGGGGGVKLDLQGLGKQIYIYVLCNI